MLSGACYFNGMLFLNPSIWPCTTKLSLGCHYSNSHFSSLGKNIVSFCSCELSSLLLKRTESWTYPLIDRDSWGMIVYCFRREGLSSRKKISFGVVAMATWLELSICKLVFCILSLANIYFSPPPLTRFCVSPPHLSLSVSHTHYYSSSYFV